MLAFFDSGFGGLTALKEAVKILPQYDYLYLGDTARTPYGTRAPETVRRFVFEGVSFLVRRGAQVIVLACNTASALAYPWIAERFPEVTILSIIPPTVQAALMATRNGKIGVVGTSGTIASGAYGQAVSGKQSTSPQVHKSTSKKGLKDLYTYGLTTIPNYPELSRTISNSPHLTSIACPLLVPLIEEGVADLPETQSILKKYLAPLLRARVDTVILGCTHYPLLEKTFQKILGKKVQLISSGQIAAENLKTFLQTQPKIEQTLARGGKIDFFTTDAREKFEHLGRKFFGKRITAQKVSLHAEQNFVFEEPVGILGYGLEGQSVHNFLKKHGVKKIAAFDQNPRLKIPGVKKFLGPNYLKHLPEVRTLFRSPGIRPIGAGVAQNRTGALQNRGGVLQYAPTQYAPTSLTQFFFDHAPTQKIIGVTGTKGKGTTSTLIHNILRRAGKNVFLGGNIGVSPLEFLEVLTPNDFVVLELSSFQLMDLNRSPHIAVLLQTTSEHLDYHKDTAEYLNAKKNLVAHQRLGDFFIHHAETDCAEDFKKVTPAVALNYSRLQCKGVLQYAPTNGFVDNNKLWIKLPHWEHAEWIAEIGKIGLRGEHNFENIFAAALATSLSGSDLKSIRTEIKNFRGLPHRLELVGELDSVEYFNDSFSTTPETTIAALKSFPEKSGIVVILGGSEKGSDYTELGQVISQLQNLRAVVLIGVTAPKIRAAIERAGGTVQFLDGGKTMREIIQTARSVAQTGDAVLLSPACASFDLFKNYKERGEEFKSMVQESISP